MNNPFTIMFGKVPAQAVERPVQSTEIFETFTAGKPNQQVYMITGVRGSGKTVLLTEMSQRFGNEKDWIVVDLIPERDLLVSLTAELSARIGSRQLLKDAKFSPTTPIGGVEIDRMPPVTDVVVILDELLKDLTKKDKRVLVTVDETLSNKYVREFVSQFQVFLRKDYNIFLLMTGLYENIYELQNEKTLTFLYRAPKIEMPPLNLSAVAKKYQEIFKLDDKQAREMARMTNGYPFAFQALGYLTWEAAGDYRAAREKYEQYLEEFVYEKIWSELSAKDKTVARAIAESDSGNVRQIREALNMTTNEFNPYRSRLKKKGIVQSVEYGSIAFTLPYFGEYVRRTYDV